MRLLNLLLILAPAAQVMALEPIPDKLVVLTFDDASKSHVTVAAPLLKKHGFSATFFVTEGFDFPTNKRDYMTWEDIAQLHRDGFEIGNHTRDHKAPAASDSKGTIEQLEAINARCVANGIPRPVSFAYPGNVLDKDVLPILHGLKIKFARRGGSPEYAYDRGRGFAYEPGSRPPPAHSLSGRRPPRLDTRRLQAGGFPGQGRQDCRHSTPRRPRYSSCVGQHADASVRVVREIPRRQWLPGSRTPRPRPLRRSQRCPFEPLGRDRGPQGPARVWSRRLECPSRPVRRRPSCVAHLDANPPPI